MRIKFIVLGIIIIILGLSFVTPTPQKQERENKKENYWLVLNRKSNTEILYFGVPGGKDHSRVEKTFQVKSGNFLSSPTPLPKFLGRQYWLITKKEASELFETAPYFLTLDIPFSEEYPFGPTPYPECEGNCNWQLPGAFGLHGINGDLTRLEGDGSSGCVRHSDEDIKYLYNVLTPEKDPIRYYIEDI